MGLSERLTTWPAWRFDPFLFLWVAASAGLTLGWAHCECGLALGPTIALLGAIAACCGVLTIGSPVIRVGGYREWYRRENTQDGGGFEATPEQNEEERQGQMDAVALQIVGPALVIIGTMLGGVSGFLP